MIRCMRKRFARNACCARRHRYVMKEVGGETLLQALRLVLDGNVHVSPHMSAQLLDSLAPARPRDSDSPVKSSLTANLRSFNSSARARAPATLPGNFVSVRKLSSPPAAILSKNLPCWIQLLSSASPCAGSNPRSQRPDGDDRRKVHTVVVVLTQPKKTP